MKPPVKYCSAGGKWPAGPWEMCSGWFIYGTDLVRLKAQYWRVCE